MQIYINQSICLLFSHHLHRTEACACHYPVPGKHCCHWNVCHYVHLVIFMTTYIAVLVRAGRNYISSQEYVSSISPSLCNVNKLNYLNFSYCQFTGIIPKCDNVFFNAAYSQSSMSHNSLSEPCQSHQRQLELNKALKTGTQLYTYIKLFKWHSALKYRQAEQSHIPFIIR